VLVDGAVDPARAHCADRRRPAGDTRAVAVIPNVVLQRCRSNRTYINQTMSCDRSRHVQHG
jgi:hypothetical protein